MFPALAIYQRQGEGKVFILFLFYCLPTNHLQWVWVSLWLTPLTTPAIHTLESERSVGNIPLNMNLEMLHGEGKSE